MDNGEITYANRAVREMENPEDKIHDLVIEKYSEIAEGKSSGCMPSCCGGSTPFIIIKELGKALDDEEDDLLLAHGEANLGLGCGNPVGMADLKPG